MGWFKEWFGTAYYNLLYEHRDDEEAQKFLDKLITFLPVSKGDTILDVGCGNGRHSIYLAGQGFRVTGIDVMEENINVAKPYESATLHFIRHDMRERFPVKGFDLALNLFTSFGYFDKTEEEIKALSNINEALNPGGTLVIDFLNAQKVCKSYVPHEEIDKEGVHFDITRYIQNKHIIKEIVVNNLNEECRYKEVVELLELKDFQGLLSMAGFRISHTFGNYDLSAFESGSSERLIIVAGKSKT